MMWNRGTILTLGLLAVLAGVAYANSLRVGFVFDDKVMIEENTLLTKLDYLPTILASDYWAGRRAQSEVVPWRSGLYRPLVLVTFALNHAWGKLNPVGYHLVNVILHLGVTWLVYLLAIQIGMSQGGSLVPAAIFAVHPLHTEAVTGIVGRAELLMACGMLGALWFAGHGQRVLSLMMFGMALLSKEQAVVFPVVLVLYDLCANPSTSNLEHRTSNATGISSYVVRRYGPYVLILLGYLLVRHAVLGRITVVPPHFIDNPLAHADGYVRVLSAIKIAGLYLWLCLWPAKLSADYSYNAIPMVHSMFEPGFLLALIAWLVLLGLALRSFLKGGRRICFAIGLVVLTFLPTSNLVVPIGTIMGERLFYLPSVGVCLLAGLAYERLAVRNAVLRTTYDAPRTWHLARRIPLASYLAPRTFVTVLVGLVCLALTLRTIDRNREWVSSETLMESAMKAYPASTKVHSMLGALATTRADWIGARDHLQTAIGLYPEYPYTEVEINFNLGKVLLNTNEPEKAIEAFERAVALDPTSSLTLYNLGAAYLAARQYSESESALRASIRVNPKLAKAYSALSWLLIVTDRYEEALSQAEKAIQLDPKLREARLNRARAMEGLGRTDEARAELLREGGSVSEPGLLGRKKSK